MTVDAVREAPVVATVVAQQPQQPQPLPVARPPPPPSLVSWRPPSLPPPPPLTHTSRRFRAPSGALSVSA